MRVQCQLACELDELYPGIELAAEYLNMWTFINIVTDRHHKCIVYKHSRDAKLPISISFLFQMASVKKKRSLSATAGYS